jgi:hypothetical protein
MDLLKRWSVGGVALIALSMGMPIAAHADTFLINQDNLGIGYVAMTGGTGFAASNTHAVPGPVVGAGLPGIVVACGGLLALARRRRQRLALGNALSQDWFFAGLARRWRQLIA